MELYRRAIDAFNRRDLDAFLSMFDPEVQFFSRFLELEGGGPYRGNEGLRSWWDELFDVSPDFRGDIEEIRNLGDNAVIARVRFHGHGAESSVPMDQAPWQIVRVRLEGHLDGHLPERSGSPQSRRAVGVATAKVIGTGAALVPVDACTRAHLSRYWRAMSEENVEIVCGMLAAWAGGEREAARGAFDPYVLLIAPAPDVPVMHGVEAMERALQEWRRTFDEWQMEVEETIDGGDHVIVISRQWGTGRGSGAPVEFRNASVYSLRNSKIIRAEVFNSKQEALEAAGLSE